jgi:hypothetical protein
MQRCLSLGTTLHVGTGTQSHLLARHHSSVYTYNEITTTIHSKYIVHIQPDYYHDTLKIYCTHTTRLLPQYTEIYCTHTTRLLPQYTENILYTYNQITTTIHWKYIVHIQPDYYHDTLKIYCTHTTRLLPRYTQNILYTYNQITTTIHWKYIVHIQRDY